MTRAARGSFDIMKTLVRFAVVGVLLVLQQLVPASAGWAQQIDPCEPVPIDDVCDVVDPSPSPSPSPSPDDRDRDRDRDGGGGGGNRNDDGDGGGNRTGGGNGPGDRARPPGDEQQPAPFVLGGPKNTSKLVAILSEIKNRIPLRESILKVVGPFPVAGLSWWANDWHAPRCCPLPHLHVGLDMFAAEGTPVVAAADGVISQKVNDPDAAGLGLEVTDDAGIQYFYAHLVRFEPGIEVGTTVDVGQVIGYIGTSGNAQGTSPHVHFEVQPGGVPVPPKPFVDDWLKVAEQRALQLVSRVTGQPIPEGSDFRIRRAFDLAGGGVATEQGSEELLVLAGVQPSVSSMEVARRTLLQMAWEIDWTGQADAQLARLASQYAQIAQGDLSAASPWQPVGISNETIERIVGT